MIANLTSNELCLLWLLVALVAVADIAWFTYACPSMVGEEVKEKWAKDKRIWVQQYLFNFLGCLIGWLALYFVVYRISAHGILQEFAVWDAVGVLVAFLGITGHLPVFIMQIVKWGGIPH